MRSKRNRRILALACMFMFLLSGCQIGGKAPGITESQVWETMPALTYGEMQYEKLCVLPWYSGRTEATSFNMWAEAEDGYYAHLLPNLLYADKADLENWVPVCNNPGCHHEAEHCSAYMGYEQFLIHDGRIFITQPQDYYKGDGAELTGYVLMGMDRDGSNKKLEYAFERQDPSSTARSIIANISNQGFFYCEYVLNTDGTHTRYLYRVNAGGAETVLKTDTGDEYISGYGGLSLGIGEALYGDRYLIVGNRFSEHFENTQFYRLLENDMELLDIQALSFDQRTLGGAYLSGDIIRCYRQNDGYYDINIRTGEEIKVADAQLQDAGAFIVLPNCVLESTMGWENYEGEGVPPSGGEHQLMLFDGERWRSVELPEELRTADAGQCIAVEAVTSDTIIVGAYNLFTRQKIRKSTYYTIDLSQEELKMEYAYEWRD